MCTKIEETTSGSLGFIRIILTSRKITSLEKICQNIINSSKNKNLKVIGPKRIPTKSLVVTTRKSPCGEGTNTWDRFEIKIHKRIIDLFSEDNIVNHITTINIESGVEIEVTYLNKKKRNLFL
nr:40S ribosomal protein S20 [Cryptomonas curvata]